MKFFCIYAFSPLALDRGGQEYVTAALPLR